MKLQDYKSEDIEAVIELKEAALHQIKQIEKAIWTDNVNEATARISQLYQTMQRVRVKKNAKQDERTMQFLASELQKKGIRIEIIPIKKAD